jgi:acetyl esterase/lipase
MTPNRLTRAVRFLRFRPARYLANVRHTCTTLPVVGSQLRRLGRLTSIRSWSSRFAPDVICWTLDRIAADQNAERRRQDWARLVSSVAVALEDIMPPDQLNTDWPAPEPIQPVLRAMQHRRRYLYRSALRYGDAPQHVLDIWRRKDLPSGPVPVLLFVPGGAWVYGKRTLQGYALMSHLAEQGWLCVAIDHRAGPGHRWPRHVQDVRMAVEWVRANVDQFGGDPSFVAIAGASSGAHLAAVTALAHDDPDYGVESTGDTSVDAVVALYGRYDWEDMSTRQDKGLVQFLERIVVGKRMHHHPHVFRNASPIALVRPDAPPFLVVHGTADRFVPVERARAFVEKLQSTSRAPVCYLELPDARHCFDMTDGIRTGTAVTAIRLFLDEIRRTHRSAAQPGVSAADRLADGMSAVRCPGGYAV